jgi:hypothetical protein
LTNEGALKQPTELPPALRSWAEARRGPLASATPAGHAWGEGEVWRLALAGGEAAYLKRHRHPRNYLQERDAYLEWGPSLGALLPALWGHDDDQRALLLAEAAGQTADQAALSRAEVEEVHRLAGRFRRALCELPHRDADPLPLARAIPQRARAWCQRARKRLDPKLVEPVERAFAQDPNLFGEAQRAPSHRDFCPRNWVVRATQGASPSLTVIDLGHARADHPLSDWVKLWDEVWRHDPSLQAPWLDGFGRALTEGERAQLAALTKLHALGTVLWAREHGARGEEERAHLALQDALGWAW